MLNQTTVMTSEVTAPARVYRTAAYTTIAGFNPGYYDHVEFDPGGHMALYNGTYNYLVPHTGYYWAQVNFITNNAAGQRALVGIGSSNSVGAFVAELTRGRDTTTSYNPQGLQAAGIDYYTAGTYLTGYIYTNPACTLYVSQAWQYFSIFRVA